MLEILPAEAEIEARLRNSKVDIVCLEDTLLLDNREETLLSGYTIVGHLVRALGPKTGYAGIAVFARTRIADIALAQ